MKKLFLILLVLAFCVKGYCADTKVSALTDITSPALGDDMYIVDDPDGTPISRKINIGNLLAVANDLDASGDVADDSHDHIYSNIDSFTEANLYSILSDVTQFYEAGDKVGDADTLDTHDTAYFQIDLTDEASLYTALSDVTQFYEAGDDISADESDPNVDTEAEIEAITGALFGTSKAVTGGHIWVADGVDFESVAMSGDVTIAAGGATTVGDDSHAHVYSNIDSFTEANLYTILSDVSQFWESGDSVTGAIGTDEAYAVGWNADTGVAEKDDIYDYLVSFDADADSSFTDETWYTNILDGTAVFSDLNGNDIIDSDNYAADSIDDEHINWADIPVTATATLVDPDTTQATIDAVTIFPIEAERFPNGITITDCGIKTDASSSYTVVFEEWTAPDTHANDLESVATSTSLEAEDDGTIGNGSGGSAGDCNAGSIIKIDLPATDIDELSVWIVFTVNQS